MVDAVSRRYEIVCRLAGGGMADLYLARTLGPGGFERLVVIKRLAKRLASQASAVQALLDEARIAATLSHANIVQVTDIEIADGQVSIVMEFLHGHDASHLLRRVAKLREVVPLDQAVAIVLGVCAGLHHAHERVDRDGKSLDIVHRDVSPHNVFITYDGAVKLVDFGIARAATRKDHTEHGFIKGKPGYIAPEQIRGRKTDRRTDVWGAAVLLYELTTGVTPYGPGTNFDDLAKVTKQDPVKPSLLSPNYPAELEAIVMKGLARDPAARYETADAMRIALDDFARSRNLDLSPFRMGALMERVFSENLEAWRQSQRMGRSLAEHVAAFKTSGSHDLVELPGDPTEPFITITGTNPIVTKDVVVITASTRLIKVQPRTPIIEDEETTASAGPPLADDVTTPIEDVTTPIQEMTTPIQEVTTPIQEMTTPIQEVTTPRPATRSGWRLGIAVGLATPLVLMLSLLAWGVLDTHHSTAALAPQPLPPPAETAEEPRATAVDDAPVAQPITVVPIEPEPTPAEPAAIEPSIETESAVAHAAPTPARKRPSAKSAPKRRAVRSVQPPRTVPTATPPSSRSSPPPAEDDLDALLPH
jgi:serine/threonine protein kinase